MVSILSQEELQANKIARVKELINLIEGAERAIQILDSNRWMGPINIRAKEIGTGDLPDELRPVLKHGVEKYLSDLEEELRSLVQ